MHQSMTGMNLDVFQKKRIKTPIFARDFWVNMTFDCIHAASAAAGGCIHAAVATNGLTDKTCVEKVVIRVAD